MASEVKCRITIEGDTYVEVRDQVLMLADLMLAQDQRETEPLTSDAETRRSGETGSALSEPRTGDLGELADMPAKAVSALERADIYLIAELIERTADEIVAIPGLGPRTVDQIREALAKVGLSLAGEGDTVEDEEEEGATEPGPLDFDAAVALVQSYLSDPKHPKQRLARLEWGTVRAKFGATRPEQLAKHSAGAAAFIEMATSLRDSPVSAEPETEASDDADSLWDDI